MAMKVPTIVELASCQDTITSTREKKDAAGDGKESTGRKHGRGAHRARQPPGLAHFATMRITDLPDDVLLLVLREAAIPDRASFVQCNRRTRELSRNAWGQVFADHSVEKMFCTRADAEADLSKRSYAHQVDRDVIALEVVCYNCSYKHDAAEGPDWRVAAPWLQRGLVTKYLGMVHRGKLRHIDLKVHGYGAFPDLSALHRLESCVLEDCADTGTMRAAYLPASLTEAVLCGISFTGAASLPRLCTLDLGGSSCLTFPLADAPDLEAIAFKRDEPQDEDDTFDLSPALASCAALECLYDMAVRVPGQTLDALAHVTGLESLCITQGQAFNSAVLRHLTHLKTFELEDGRVDVGNLPRTLMLLNLRHVRLSGPHTQLPSLKSLMVGGSSLAHVPISTPHLTNLSCLGYGADEAPDPSLGHDLPGLRFLRLARTSACCDLLPGLTNLEWLWVDGSGIDLTTAFLGMTKLRDLTLRVKPSAFEEGRRVPVLPRAPNLRAVSLEFDHHVSPPVSDDEDEDPAPSIEVNVNIGPGGDIDLGHYPVLRRLRIDGAVVVMRAPVVLAPGHGVVFDPDRRRFTLGALAASDYLDAV